MREIIERLKNNISKFFRGASWFFGNHDAQIVEENGSVDSFKKALNGTDLSPEAIKALQDAYENARKQLESGIPFFGVPITKNYYPSEHKIPRGSDKTQGRTFGE